MILSGAGHVANRRSKLALTLPAVLGIVLAGLIYVWVSAPGASGAQTAERSVTVNVGGVVGRRIQPGFAGLSLEYTTLPAYAGTNPKAVDPVLEQLIRNISPGQRPVLRIGGDTTDWTWWPVHGWKKPPWARYTLNKRWMAIMHAVSKSVNAMLIPGLNFEANSRAVVRAEAQAMLHQLGRNSIDAFELGNEPELYESFSWYRTASGGHVRGRASGWDWARFAHDYKSVSSAIPGGLPLAGPGTGGGTEWTKPLPSFLRNDPRVKVVTLHRYGLDGCSRLVPITGLLSDTAQAHLAQRVSREVQTAHAHHVQLRVEEMNTVACGGQAGVSNTFAAALWLLDTLFETARVGVDGINVHTNPRHLQPTASASSLRFVIRSHRKSSGLNSLFDFHRIHGTWHASVLPEYYGMLLFAQAAPADSQLLKSSVSPGTSTLHTWTTRAPDGTIHVVLINESLRQSVMANVRVPGEQATAQLERLSAPRLSATGGTTLGGHGFGPSTTTGTLPAAVPLTVTPAGGDYAVRVPATSAAMLTLPATGTPTP